MLGWWHMKDLGPNTLPTERALMRERWEKPCHSDFPTCRSSVRAVGEAFRGLKHAEENSQHLGFCAINHCGCSGQRWLRLTAAM